MNIRAMPFSLTSPTGTRSDVSSTRNAVSPDLHRLYQQRKLKTAIRYRRRLVCLRAAFQQDLDRALSAKLQRRLGLRIRLNEQGLKPLHFIAHFEFEGQQWVLTCQRYFWRCDWFFTNTEQHQVVRCTDHTLEHCLCHTLKGIRQRSRPLAIA